MVPEAAGNFSSNNDNNNKGKKVLDKDVEKVIGVAK